MKTALLNRPLIARNFDGVDDLIEVGIGASDMGFGSLAAIIRKSADVPGDYNAISDLQTSAAVRRFGMHLNDASPSRVIWERNGSGESSNASVTLTTAQGWAMVAATKATGTVAPRLHRFLYSTGAWVHGNGVATLANSSLAGAGGNWRIGNVVAGSTFFPGDMLVLAVWPSRVLTDAELEALPYQLSAWRRSGPSGLWTFNQTNTGQRLLDLTPGRGDQSSLTGTSVSAWPTLSFRFD